MLVRFHPNDAALVGMIVGAQSGSRGIDYFGPGDTEFAKWMNAGVAMGDIAVRRVARRAIVRAAGGGPSADWVRRAHSSASDAEFCVSDTGVVAISGRDMILLAGAPGGPEGAILPPERLSLLPRPGTYRAFFEDLWRDLNTQVGFLSLNSPVAPEALRRLEELDATVNSIVIADVLRDRRRALELESRQFEYLVAEALIRRGLTVTLTPASGDGGYDIVALKESEFGELRFLVECKRYAPHNPVGVEIVRALHGVVDDQRATAGIVVTTSGFTRGAKELQERHPHRLKLLDYETLCSWLRA